jgi:hypothetical protein
MGQGGRHGSCRGRDPEHPLQVAQRTREQARSVEHPIFHRTLRVDGVPLFCWNAGPKDAPTLLLLHGLPSSSRVFEPLLARLSGSYQLIAPDHPRFRPQRATGPESAERTPIDRDAEISGRFTQALGFARLRIVHAGLRRPGRLSDGAGAPGSDRCCSSRPLRPGTVTSRIRQQGAGPCGCD